MKPITIRCSGVPEHFNLPWLLAHEKGLFAQAGIDWQWINNGSGTGSMCADLRDDKTDMALLLTEGAVRDLHHGNPSKICSFYVESPLIWGVHAGAKSTLTADQLHQNISFAISRFTSGSHLMAYVYAKQKGIALEQEHFSVINNLDGARQSLAQHNNQLFLWEKFTTKPVVDAGDFTRIDECPTPWPAFVVVASDKLLGEAPQAVETALAIVQEEARQLKANPLAAKLIAERFGLKTQDAQIWFDAVRWSTHSEVETTTLIQVADTLRSLHLLEGDFDAQRLVHQSLVTR